ncbi:MAG: peptidase C25 [Thermoplasmata archaeon]|nr:MAG: peptidase C25 [Thermoplasmata archaeon]
MKEMRIKGGIISIVIFTILLTPAFAGIENIFNDNREVQAKAINLSFDFSPPEIKEKDEYVAIDFEGRDNYLIKDGYPTIPYEIKVLKFPFGTKIEGIEFQTSEIKTMHLSKKVMPSPPSITSNMGTFKVETKEGEIYASNEPYPTNWISYNIGAGIDGKQHVIYLTIHLYPARYIPAENEIQYVDKIDIDIYYSPSEKPLFTNGAYDLLIIAPAEFREDLQPLAEHKESYGLKTIIVTLDEIYGGNYFLANGRDDAEKIKYFIKNAVEEWGVEYVLLVGGRNGGVKEEKWWVPVRYSYLDDGGEKKFISDLYFADIYKYEDGDIVFEDWDSNGNDVFGEWHMRGKDVLDLYPDVYVGRLACRNRAEVKIMVDKIITYETTAYGSNWFKRFVAVAGDTYPSEGDPYYEGEVATAEAFKYLDGFEATFLWTSTGNLTGSRDIINAVSQGCGFLYFSGHGNPMSWANHPPGDEETWIGIDVTSFYKFSNDGMYPICVIGGCHNNQFNVSILNLLKLRHLKEVYYKSEWTPECFGWWLARKIGGGSIATIANTGFGYGIPGENCLTGRGRYMEIHFFKSYAEGKEMLGEAHASDLTYYLNAFPPMVDRIDTKIVEQWVLLGDPSLKIGGYA